MASWISFLFFAGLAVGCALISLFHRSVVHSAFALLGTLMGVAGLYLMLGADYLAVTQVLIYAGGILVLILFGLMLTPGDPTELRLARVLGGIALIGGGGALFLFKMSGASRWHAAPPDQLAPPDPTVTRIGLELLRQDRFLLPFELASVILLAALVGSVFIARRRVQRDGGAA
ncbi:MAG: NADH-quinone oxidoreductase subunit J [Planctomycetota bacterium]|nr:MAG: NADH-quinone oxidoreductase subunit J [Planctomycetota bacterium]